MQNFSQNVILCINASLTSLKLRGRINALYHVTPELVTSIAENYFNRSIKRICDFLDAKLSEELNAPKPASKQDKLLSHLSDEHYNRGDLFTVISVAEIVYSLQRKAKMPAFPIMSPEICAILKRKNDINSAHGNFLRQKMRQNGGCDVAQQAVQQCRINDTSKIQQTSDEKIVEFKKALFESYLLPIIQNYYMNYQTDSQIRYTIFRLQQKLNHEIDRAVHHRKQEFAEYQRELEFQIKQQFNYALKVEKRNLRDEAKWREDERSERRKEAAKIASGVQTRRQNEVEMRAEKEDERKIFIQNLREEEIKYSNMRRKEEEERAFKVIQAVAANLAVGKAPKDMSKVLKYTEKDVVERLRLYQGAEQIYAEGGKDRMARSSYQ